MATSYTTVYDSFMLKIKDYQLTALYQSSPTNFKAYLKGFLIDAIQDFVNSCRQDLTDRDDDTNFEFNIDLEDTNIYILAELMVKHWLEKEIQDTSQMKLHLTDRDFKHYSEAQNLDAKNRYHANVLERTSQLIVDYEFDETDWSGWANGDFGVT